MSHLPAASLPSLCSPEEVWVLGFSTCMFPHLLFREVKVIYECAASTLKCCAEPPMPLRWTQVCPQSSLHIFSAAHSPADRDTSSHPPSRAHCSRFSSFSPVHRALQSPVVQAPLCSPATHASRFQSVYPGMPPHGAPWDGVSKGTSNST